MRGWVAKALTRCGEVVSQLHKLWVNSDNVPLSFYTWLWDHTHNWKLRWKLKFPMTVGSTLRQRCFMNKCFLHVNSSRKTRKHLEMSSSFVSFCLQFLTQFLLTPLCVPVYRIPGRLTVKAKKKKKTFFFSSGWDLLFSCSADKSRSALPRLLLFSVSEPPAVFPSDSLLSEPFMLKNLLRMSHTDSEFYRQWGTIGHNEVLLLSVSLRGSWLQMRLSLSPVISCLIEDNIMRQCPPPTQSLGINGIHYGRYQSAKSKVQVMWCEVREWVCTHGLWMCSSLFNLDHEDGQLNYRSLGAVFLGLLLHFMPAGPCKCLWMCLGHALEVEVGEGGVYV